MSYLFPSPLPWTGRPPFLPWRKLLVLPIRRIPPPLSRYYDSRHTTARRTPCVVVGLTPHDRKAAAHGRESKEPCPCLAHGRHGRVLKPDPYGNRDVDVEVTLLSSVIVAPSTWPDTKSDSSCPGPCSVVVTTLASPEQRRTTYICPPIRARQASLLSHNPHFSLLTCYRLLAYLPSPSSRLVTPHQPSPS